MKHTINAIVFCIFFASCNKGENIIKNSPNIIDSSNICLLNEVTISGTPYNSSNHYYYVAGCMYGTIPYIILKGNNDNSFDIAWLNLDTDRIIIEKCDPNGRIVNKIVPSYIGQTKRLLGFTPIPTDQSYVVGYSKDNDFGDKDFEFWITRFNSNGDSIFNKRIFGHRPSTENGSHGEPGDHSSSRIIYNDENNMLCFFLGHTKLFGELRHQGGYFDFLHLDGSPFIKENNYSINVNDWHVSHNFDQRLIYHNGTYLTVSLGDAYPRALVISSWNDNPKERILNYKKEFFEISGEIGDNRTNTQLGNIIALPDGNYGIIFSSSIDRTKRDICFVKVDINGKVLNRNWLTENTELNTYFPKIGLLNNGSIVLAWINAWINAKNHQKFKTSFLQIDFNGNKISDEILFEGELLSPVSDFITQPNGRILWTIGTDKNTLKTYTIDVN